MLPNRLRQSHRFYQIANRLLDMLYGVETRRNVSVEAFQAHPYAAIDWFSFGAILRAMKIKSDDVFLDLGCGKGRGLLIASTFSFKRILGVEISPKLCEVAKQNLQRYRRRVFRPALRCSTFEVTQANAASFQIPNDVTVVFLFNPFFGETFDQVLENLVRSAQNHPRPLRVIYAAPVFYEQVRSHSTFRELEIVPRQFSQEYRVYLVGSFIDTPSPGL